MKTQSRPPVFSRTFLKVAVLASVVTAGSTLCLLPQAIAANDQTQALQETTQEVLTHEKFAKWKQSFIQRIKIHGFNLKTKGIVSSMKMDPRVLRLDDNQPEEQESLWTYIGRRVTQNRISLGERALETRASILQEVHAKYGIPPHILVAFWGLETDFGTFQGNYNVLNALATLAADGRRQEKFENELIIALRLIEKGYTQKQLIGSWAGAMGHFQFMPSTLLAHGVSEHYSKLPDIWMNFDDAVLSAGKYLAAVGWDRGVRWGRQIKLPKNFDYNLISETEQKPLTYWAAKNIRTMQGAPLPALPHITGRILLPEGRNGPAFIVYKNFDVILDWNRSNSYALAVGLLSDQLAGRAGLIGTQPKDHHKLSTTSISKMQHALKALKYKISIDGQIGPETRTAVRAFQAKNGFIPDAFPTEDLLKVILKKADLASQ